MRYLFISLNFSPEQVGVGKYAGQIVDYLRSGGSVVDVVSTIPHYPDKRLCAPLIQNGVVRLPVLSTGFSVGSRIVRSLGFGAMAAPCAMAKAMRRPDAVVLTAPTMAAAPAALAAARLSGAATALHLHDLELDAAAALGMLPSSCNVLDGLYGKLLHGFDSIIVLSAGMAERVRSLGVEKSRIRILPNWADEMQPVSPKAQAMVRALFKLSAGEKTVLFSGSFGRKNDFDAVLQGADRLAYRADIRFVLCGDGEQSLQLKQAAKLRRNVDVYGLQPRPIHEALLQTPDLHIVPQRAGLSAELLPSKPAGIMAVGGVPLIGADEGSDLMQVAIDAGCPTYVAGDAAALTDLISTLIDDSKRRRSISKSVRAYAAKRLTSSAGLARFASMLEEAVHRKRSAAGDESIEIARADDLPYTFRRHSFFNDGRGGNADGRDAKLDAKMVEEQQRAWLHLD